MAPEDGEGGGEGGCERPAVGLRSGWIDEAGEDVEAGLQGGGAVQARAKEVAQGAERGAFEQLAQQHGPGGGGDGAQGGAGRDAEGRDGGVVANECAHGAAHVVAVLAGQQLRLGRADVSDGADRLLGHQVVGGVLLGHDDDHDEEYFGARGGGGDGGQSRHQEGARGGVDPEVHAAVLVDLVVAVGALVAQAIARAAFCPHPLPHPLHHGVAGPAVRVVVLVVLLLLLQGEEAAPLRHRRPLASRALARGQDDAKGAHEGGGDEVNCTVAPQQLPDDVEGPSLDRELAGLGGHEGEADEGGPALLGRRIVVAVLFE